MGLADLELIELHSVTTYGPWRQNATSDVSTRDVIVTESGVTRITGIQVKPSSDFMAKFLFGDGTAPAPQRLTSLADQIDEARRAWNDR